MVYMVGLWRDYGGDASDQTFNWIARVSTVLLIVAAVWFARTRAKRESSRRSAATSRSADARRSLGRGGRTSARRLRSPRWSRR